MPPIRRLRPHCVTGDAPERIRASPLTEVLVTDTVPLMGRASERGRQVSVAPLFAAAIRSIFEETSISRLFA